MFWLCIVYKILSYKVVLSLGRLRKFDKKIDSVRIILMKDIWG